MADSKSFFGAIPVASSSTRWVSFQLSFVARSAPLLPCSSRIGSASGRGTRAYGELHDKDRAIKALDEACAERNVFALLLNSDPFYDGLRKDRRFAGILKRHRLQAESASGERVGVPIRIAH
jgi:hypothetical protein